MTGRRADAGAPPGTVGRVSGRVPAKAHALAIVSSYPPPHGGVSTEVLRLRPLLDGRGVDYVVYNTASESAEGERVVAIGRRRRSWWTLGFLLTCRERAVYLMTARLVVWVLGSAILRLRGRRVLVQLRNARLLDFIAQSHWQRTWAGFALRRMTRVVCVSHRLVEAARSLGVEERQVFWCPAFLPPTPAAAADRLGVAPEVWHFAARRHPVIAANGKVGFYAGQDLYGLDLLVELAARLKKDYSGLGIVVCFWDHQPKDDAPLARLQERAAERGVEHAIYFNTRSGTFIPVLQAADLFIRPTNTDGDAVSVREALYLGVPTIASDAVERPEGTILFRNRDLDDLEVKVRAVLGAGAGLRLGREPRLSDEDRRRIDAYVGLLAAMAGGT
jgi:glycosyltransferase involved in cell wall biosynthesis